MKTGKNDKQAILTNRSRSRFHVATGGALLVSGVVAAAGCSPTGTPVVATQTPGASEPGAPSSPEAPPTATTEAPTSAPTFAPAPGTLPPTRPTEATPDERVGTLPEGVGVPVGARMPDATIHDIDGNDVQLSELAARGPMLVVFYRGGWCPYCNFQIHDLAQAYGEFERRGVTPVAISVDEVDPASRTQASWEIPFSVLSDPDLVAHTAFGVLHRASDDEVERLAGFGMDIEASSGRDHHTFAIPSVFLIDAQGVVRWAHADADYRVRPTIAHLLAAVDATLGAHAPE